MSLVNVTQCLPLNEVAIIHVLKIQRQKKGADDWMSTAHQT